MLKVSLMDQTAWFTRLAKYIEGWQLNIVLHVKKSAWNALMFVLQCQ